MGGRFSPQTGSIVSILYRKKAGMNFLAYIQHLFPGEHRLYSLFYGFSFGFVIIMPRPNWLSKSACLVGYGVLIVILGLCLYFARPKERLTGLDGWRALGLAASGLLFHALSVFDWLVCLNDPIAMTLAGGIVLLLCAIFALWKTTHSETDWPS